MPSSRGSSNSTGTLWAMIIFIVLFLVVSVVAIMQLMSNEQLKRERDDAVAKFNRLAKPEEFNSVQMMVNGPRDTVLKQITNDMRFMSELVLGEVGSDFDLAGSRNMVERRTQDIRTQMMETFSELELEPLGESADGRFYGFVPSMAFLMEAVYNLRSKADLEKEQSEQAKKLFEIEKKRLDDEIKKFQEALLSCSQYAEREETEYNLLEKKNTDNYEQTFNLLSEEITKKDKDLNEKEALIQAKDEKIQGLNEEVKNYRERLSQIQPEPDYELVARKPDGYIVSVVPGEKLAYINLNRKDSIYRGLTFAIYDSYTEISNDSKKGSLEVVEVMDNISKCRITASDPINPILEKDLIGNLIWSEDTQYSFCVIGDYDFDGDGIIDAGGESRMRQLIDNWGGTSNRTVSVDTDFLVLGHKPVLPERPSDEDFDSQSAKALEYNQILKEIEAYDNVIKNATALGVPTFNLDRFLHFIGYYQQARSSRL